MKMSIQGILTAQETGLTYVRLEPGDVLGLEITDKRIYIHVNDQTIFRAYIPSKSLARIGQNTDIRLEI